MFLRTIKRILDYLERKEFQRLLKSNLIELGSNVIFKKNPLIQLHPLAKLIIGDNVTINSDNYGYHVNMHSPAKLMADRPNAIIKIGNGSIIGANSVVENDIPPMSIAKGVPAKVVKSFYKEKLNDDLD